MPGMFEIMLVGLVCFNLGNTLGYKRHSHEHHKKPTKQNSIFKAPEVK